MASSLFQQLSLLTGVPSFTPDSTDPTPPPAFQWNKWKIGLVAVASVPVVASVALAIFATITLQWHIAAGALGVAGIILTGTWILIGRPTLDDMVGNSTPATPEEQLPLLQNSRRMQEEITLTMNRGGNTDESQLRVVDHPPQTLNQTSQAANVAFKRATTSSDPTLAGQSSSPSRSSATSEAQKAARKASSTLLKRISGTTNKNKKIDLRKDLWFAKNSLRQGLEKYRDFALEFLPCANILYNFEADAISSNSKLTELQKFDAKIALCNEIIAITPRTESGNSLIQHFEKRRSELNQQKNSLNQALEQNVMRSAQHLGQELFPGKIQGHSQGFTLSGEVLTLMDGKTLKTINDELQTAENELKSAQSSVQNAMDNLRSHENTLTRTENEFKSELTRLNLDRPKIYEGEIEITKQKIATCNEQIKRATTRRELLPLISERRDLELSLLIYQYEQERFLLDSEVRNYQSSQPKDQTPSLLIDKINSKHTEIQRIRENIRSLEKNNQILLHEIEKYREASGIEEKNRCVNNIAILLANPYCTRSAIEEDHLLILQKNPYRQVFNLDLQFSQSIQQILRRETATTTLSSYLPDFNRQLSTNHKRIIENTEKTTLTIQHINEVQTTLIAKSNAMTRIKNEIPTLVDEHTSLQSRCLRTGEKLSTLQKQKAELDEAVKKLKSHVDLAATSQEFATFVKNYIRFATETKIPQDKWASNMLGLLTEQFPLLKEFPQVKESILTALERNGVDISHRNLEAENSAPSEPISPLSSSSSLATTPFDLMMNFGPISMNIDDQIDSITREVIQMMPTAASSSGSRFTEYKVDEIEDYQQELSSKLTILRTFENPSVSTQKLQEAIQMVSEELRAVDSELSSRTSLSRRYS
ncbi:MAG: hypothetical protein AB7O89_07920 [Parachlamydiales bacterium]